MSELAVLLKWAVASLKEMFAHLSLILLLESVELALVTVKVIVIGLLSQVLEDLARWVVEVSWSAVGINTFTLIASLLSSRNGTWQDRSRFSLCKGSIRRLSFW